MKQHRPELFKAKGGDAQEMNGWLAWTPYSPFNSVFQNNIYIYIYIILDIPAGSESVLINFVYMLLFFKA